MPVARLDAIHLTRGHARVTALLMGKVVWSGVVRAGEEKRVDANTDNIIIAPVEDTEGFLVLGGRSFSFRARSGAAYLIYFDYDVSPLLLVTPVVAGIATYAAKRVNANPVVGGLAGGLLGALLGVMAMGVVPLAAKLPIGSDIVYIDSIAIRAVEAGDTAVAVMRYGETILQEEYELSGGESVMIPVGRYATTVYAASTGTAEIEIRHEYGTDRFTIRPGAPYQFDFDPLLLRFRESEVG